MPRLPDAPALWRSTIARYSASFVSAANAQTIAVSQSSNATPLLTPERWLRCSNFLKRDSEAGWKNCSRAKLRRIEHAQCSLLIEKPPGITMDTGRGSRTRKSHVLDGKNQETFR